VLVVGGDVAQADGILAASLTLLGRATGPRVLTRAGARLGDWIFVTGRLGGSLTGGHHYKFVPRLAEGAWLARQPGVRAMMDVSDGLAKDLRALTPGGTVPALAASTLPCRAGCDVCAALTDGEDYELVFTVAAKTDLAALHRAWHRTFPQTPLTRIGRFTRTLPAGALNLASYHGYEHLC
jgi:thiamine-monophosphate kinase